MAAIYRLQKVLKFREERPFAMLFNQVFTLTEYCTVQFRFLTQLVRRCAYIWLCCSFMSEASFCFHSKRITVQLFYPPFLKRDCERNGVDVLALNGSVVLIKDVCWRVQTIRILNKDIRKNCGQEHANILRTNHNNHTTGFIADVYVFIYL